MMPSSHALLNDWHACSPRGWHLEEGHFVVDGQPASGSLFDFGLYFFHNAKEVRARLL